MTKKPIIIIDGSSYLFRAYHAMPDLTNASGQPTGAIYGVINMMKRLKKDYKDHLILVVFDSKGKSTRHHYFPEYKANRPAMPEDLASQIPYIHAFITQMGLPIIKQVGIEADDIIGTLAKRFSKIGEQVIISTGDKDMAQLVNEQVTLVNTMTQTVLDSQSVKEKFGVQPDQIIDYLALMGDKVDNIPGIPSVGPKTAAKWLTMYGSLANLCAHADEIPGKVGESFREHAHLLALSQRLVTIDCDLDITISKEDMQVKPENPQALAKLYKDLNFNRWLHEMEPDYQVTDSSASLLQSVQSERMLHRIKTNDDWQSCLSLLNEATSIVVMIQNSHQDPLKGDWVALALGLHHQRFLLHFEDTDFKNSESISLKSIFMDLNHLFQNTKIQWITDDCKTFIKLCHNAAMHAPFQLFDCLLASYNLRELSGKTDLQSCAQFWLKESELIDPSRQSADKNSLIHACDILLQLHPILLNAFDEKPCAKVIYETIDLPVAKILADIEIAGVLIDPEILLLQSQTIATELSTLTHDIYHLAGEAFSIDSPKQLGAILFEKLKLPTLKKTPTGAFSTAEPVLAELAISYPLPALILHYRSLAKLKSTYTDKLPHEINPKTNRIHTTYLETGTSTGRLACVNPNLQNIPIRTERGREIRLAFIAPKDHVLIAADYSQIELRIMAHLSQDPKLLEAFATNSDVHRFTAATVLGIAPDAVTFEQRRQAKAVNFGLMYGMSAFGLAKQLGIERHEAQKFMDAYFEKYPGIKEYMDKTYEIAKQQGYVETLLQRRIAVPDITSKNHSLAQAAQRAAINAPLQGSAADIIKLAMISFTQWKNENHAQAIMIMQVHDELVFQVPLRECETTKQAIRHAMQNAIALSVPLIVDIGFGSNWQEAH
jgi:DNA polymerase-1